MEILILIMFLLVSPIILEAVFECFFELVMIFIASFAILGIIKWIAM